MSDGANQIQRLRADDNLTNASLRGRNCFAAFRGKRAAISFTGGKDCHLALQRSREAGLDVVCAVAFLSNGHSVEAHRIEWQHRQAKAMDIPLCLCSLAEHIEEQEKEHQGKTSELVIDYKAAYAAAIRHLYKKYKIDVVITGDIDFVGKTSTTNFKQQVCKEYDCHGVQALLPLWQQERKELLHEMIHQHKFDIRMCCVKTPHFDEKWIGRRLDDLALSEMDEKSRRGLDLTGENGEYHTMVVDGPMYITPLVFENANPKELLDHWGRKNGEQCWVISQSATLVPRNT